MTSYEIQLMDGTKISVEADKFHCEDANVVFYAKSSGTTKYEEVFRHPSADVKHLREE